MTWGRKNTCLYGFVPTIPLAFLPRSGLGASLGSFIYVPWYDLSPYHPAPPKVSWRSFPSSLLLCSWPPFLGKSPRQHDPVTLLPRLVAVLLQKGSSISPSHERKLAFIKKNILRIHFHLFFQIVVDRRMNPKVTDDLNDATLPPPHTP